MPVSETNVLWVTFDETYPISIPHREMAEEIEILPGNQDIVYLHCQWASYQIRKIAGCACAGNAGNVFPRRRFQRKPLVSDPGMHHGTCVTHVPWCMSGSLTRGDGENVPGIPGACAPAILRIWQEAHATAILSFDGFWTSTAMVWTKFSRIFCSTHLKGQGSCQFWFRRRETNYHFHNT